MTTSDDEIPGGLTPEQIKEYQSRFNVPASATSEFHLFRVVRPRGPAQPMPAQIPVGACASKKQAIELADRLDDNCTIIIQRREWIAKDAKTGRWRAAKPGEHLDVKDDRDA